MAVAISAVARAWILLPVLTALVGCSATVRPRAEALAPAGDGARIARVERLGRDLAHATASPDRIDVGLSTRDEVGAWSWPDGRIRLSRALVDLLDDAELAAALAHEIGHLLDAGHVAGQAAALAGGGRRDGAGIETRADGAACRLLRARGEPAALPRMLRTVAAHVVPGDGAPDPAALRARADAAEQSCVAR